MSSCLGLTDEGESMVLQCEGGGIYTCSSTKGGHDPVLKRIQASMHEEDVSKSDAMIYVVAVVPC